MKNDDLDRFTQQAEDLTQSMQPLLLDGNGRFLNMHLEIVQPSDVLAMLTAGEKKAHALYMELDNYPRRRVGQSNGNDDEGDQE